MKLARSSLSLFTAILLSAASSAFAQDATGSAPGPVRVDYSVYFGGFNVIALDIELELTQDDYNVTVNTSTIGMAGWLVPWKAVNTSEGVVNGSALAPRRHRANGQFRGNMRSVAIDYENGEVKSLNVTPQPRDDFGRDEVPREAMRGALDPSSAVLAITRRIAADGGCTGRVRVFDGRRRYDVVVAEHGPQTLEANDYNNFSGTALRCDFHVEQIAGYDVKTAPDEMRKQRFRTGRAWFAEVLPGRPAVPVRIEVDGDLAATLVHLRGVRPVVAVDGLPVGKMADN